VVIVVSAPSGAGKTTVVGQVLRELSGIHFSVSHTTRPARDEEREGVDYYFVDRAGFRKLIDEDRLLEWAEVHGNLYGTTRAELERARAEGKDVLLDLDVKGAAQVRERVPGAVTVFILPPSYAALERRLRGRGQDDEATMERRLSAAGREIGAFAAYDYLVVNDDFEACVEELASIIRAARCRVAVVAGRAREICRTFETREETKPV
jgi:guanylate kinase